MHRVINNDKLLTINIASQGRSSPTLASRDRLNTLLSAQCALESQIILPVAKLSPGKLQVNEVKNHYLRLVSIEHKLLLQIGIGKRKRHNMASCGLSNTTCEKGIYHWPMLKMKDIQTK